MSVNLHLTVLYQVDGVESLFLNYFIYSKVLTAVLSYQSFNKSQWRSFTVIPKM